MSAVVGIGDHLGRQLPVSLLVPVSVASVDTTGAMRGCGAIRTQILKGGSGGDVLISNGVCCLH